MSEAKRPQRLAIVRRFILHPLMFLVVYLILPYGAAVYLYRNAANMSDTSLATIGEALGCIGFSLLAVGIVVGAIRIAKRDGNRVWLSVGVTLCAFAFAWKWAGGFR